MEQGLSKNRILAELSKSPHGKLSEYVSVGQQAAKQEPEFLAHLVAWNHLKGQVRDSKVALPVVSLSVPQDAELAENALAHIALLGPRELLRAYHFAQELKLPGRMRQVRRLVEAYLREREANAPAWDRVAIQHRRTLKSLYALVHAKPNGRAFDVLFKREYPAGSLFEAVARLKDMAPTEAAGVIISRKIPFLVAQGALGAKAKEPDLVLALIGAMSPTELVTNTKALERLGVKTNAALRGAYEKALEKASDSKANLFKTTRAAENVEDEALKEKLQGLQERQIAKAGGVDGNWLVLGDKSGSMKLAIDVAREVSATLAKMVKGRVWLVFFDTMPYTMEVTGLSLDQIKEQTKRITANGGTSIGCGLQRMLDSKEEVDGIAIVSDAGENTAPVFPEVYKRYSEFLGKEVPVYLYQCDGDRPEEQGAYLLTTMQRAQIDLQVFDLRGSKVDFYSLANTVGTMRTNRYSLVEEVMDAKLLTLKDVFKNQTEEVRTHVAGVS